LRLCIVFTQPYESNSQATNQSNENWAYENCKHINSFVPPISYVAVVGSLFVWRYGLKVLVDRSVSSANIHCSQSSLKCLVLLTDWYEWNTFSKSIYHSVSVPPKGFIIKSAHVVQWSGWHHLCYRRLAKNLYFIGTKDGLTIKSKRTLLFSFTILLFDSDPSWDNS
jgi:hypothetical protein